MEWKELYFPVNQRKSSHFWNVCLGNQNSTQVPSACFQFVLCCACAWYFFIYFFSEDKIFTVKSHISMLRKREAAPTGGSSGEATYAVFAQHIPQCLGFQMQYTSGQDKPLTEGAAETGADLEGWAGEPSPQVLVP